MMLRILVLLTITANASLTSELRGGEGAYSHKYAYDKNDNRTKQTSIADGLITTAQVLDFTGPTLPSEVTPITGVWTLDAGKLLGAATGSGRASLGPLEEVPA